MIMLILAIIFIFSHSTNAIEPLTNQLTQEEIASDVNVVQHFSKHNGLMAEYVSDFAFSPNGITWISTVSGIYYSNGDFIKQLQKSPLENNESFSKFELVGEILWTATANYLYSINTNNLQINAFLLPPEIKRIRPNSITKFEDVLIINTSSGPLPFSLTINRFGSILELPEFSDHASSTIAFDAVVVKDSLYVGFGSYFSGKNPVQGGMARYKSNLELEKSDPVINLFAPWVIEYYSDTLYVATSNGGIKTIDLKTLKLIENIKAPTLPGNTALSLSLHDGKFYIGILQGGLLQIANGTIRQYTSTNSRISSKVTSVTKISDDGYLWIGYFDNKIDVINLNNFDNLSIERYPELKESLSVVHVLRESKIFGTSSAGVVDNGKAVKLSTLSNNLIDDAVSSIDSMDNLTVVATKGGSLWSKVGDRGFEMLSENPILQRLNVHDVLVLSESIIVASPFGYFQIDHFGKLLVDLKVEYKESKQQISHYNRQVIYLADGQRLGKSEGSLSKTEWIDITEFQIEEINGIVGRSQNSLFFTSQNKIYILNFEERTVNLVLEIESAFTGLDYADGYLVATDSQRLYIRRNNRTQIISADDGFLGDVITDNPLTIFDNEAFIATDSGIQRVRLDDITATSPKFNAIVMQLAINGSTYKQFLVNSLDLVIEPNTVLASISVVPDKNFDERKQLEYRIPTLLDEWISLDDSDNIHLPLSTFGNFAINLRDAYTKNIIDTDISFYIKKPWWLETHMLVAFALLFFTLLFSITLFQQQKAKMRRQELEAIIKDKTSVLHQTIQQKQRMFENVSHEFRTPLTIILGTLEKLRGGEQSKEREAIKLQSDRLLMLVDDLLNLTEIRHLEQSVERCDISYQVNLTVAGFESLASANNLRLLVNQNDTSVVAQVRKGALALLLNNLIGNAIKYSVKNSDILINLNAKQSTLTLEVINHSFDFDSARAKSRFARAHDGVSGSGLGLDIVDEIVSALNGTFEFRAEEERVTASVTIPIQRITEPELENANEKIEPPSSNTTFTLALAEDNVELRDYIIDELSPHFEVANFANGEELIAYLESADPLPDIVLSDVMMPKIDGFDVCKHIKSSAELKFIPVVLLSAKSDQLSRSTGFSVKADDYIEKPFTSELLVKKLLNIVTTIKDVQAKACSTLLTLDTHVSDKFLKSVKDFFAVSFDDPQANIKSLSTELNISDKTLNRKLHKEFGQTFTVLLREYRLEKAASLLLAGVSAKEACYRCGFSSQAYFGSCFKEKFGISPMQYGATNK